MVVGDLLFTGPMELTQYYVVNYRMEKQRMSDKDVMIVSITLGRRLLGRIYECLVLRRNMESIIKDSLFLVHVLILQVFRHEYHTCYN